MQTPTVSAIITVYNNERTVADAIESFLIQTFPSFEIIVVDDGSTDGTRQVIEQHYARKVKYVYQPNRGSAAARNAGVYHAKGKYLAFLDGDDMAMPERFYLQVKALDDCPAAGLAYGNIFLMDAAGAQLRLRQGLGRYKSGWVLRDLVLKNFVPFSTAMVRRDCLYDIGLFDESLRSSEDWEMLVRLSRSYQFLYINEPLIKYRIQPNSKTANLEEKERAYKCVQAKIFAENDFGVDSKRMRRLSNASIQFGLLGISLRYGRYSKALRYCIRGLRAAPAIPFYLRREILSRVIYALGRGSARPRFKPRSINTI